MMEITWFISNTLLYKIPFFGVELGVNLFVLHIVSYHDEIQ
jgi:hypothetical protein